MAARSFKTMLVCGISVLVVACPQETSFVEHYVDRMGVPDTLCVLERLRAVATNNAVQQFDDHIELGTNHRYLFESHTVVHSLSVLVRPDDSANLRHTAWAPKHSVKELQQAQRSIVEVESVLLGRCGLAWETPEESCHGRNCERLANAGD